MPTYVLECGSCPHVGDFFFADGQERVASCPECGHKFPVEGHRLYALEGLQIVGETCPRGVDYHYFDEHLGRYINGKADRAYEMEKQGLREYTPDADMADSWREFDYIIDSAPKGDSTATAAACDVIKAAGRKRRLSEAKKAIDAVDL